jgi:hypothetical protein
MHKKLFFLNILLVISALSYSQKPPETESEFERTYRRNIQKDYLHGVYIPKDLADAFVQLNRRIDTDSRTKFKSIPEDLVADKLFFSLGRWIIHNWNFYSGSRFSHYIKSLGIHHPEDMARFVIRAYHRNLNREKLDIKGLLEAFEAKQEQQKQELLKGKILHQETRQRPRPDTLKREN